MYKVETLNSSPRNKVKLNFCDDQNEWKHKLLTLTWVKINWGKVTDLMFYTNHFVLIEKSNVFKVSMVVNKYVDNVWYDKQVKLF